jgi:hypothetical protein
MAHIEGRRVDWNVAQKKASTTARWAVTMTKVRIRRLVSRTLWQLVTFCGPSGSESVGIVDLLAIRKDHRKARGKIKRGDALQIILIQVKGGSAAMPTRMDESRLRAVAKMYHARNALVASWKKGTQAQFFSYRRKTNGRSRDLIEVRDIEKIFR